MNLTNFLTNGKGKQKVHQIYDCNSMMGSTFTPVHLKVDLYNNSIYHTECEGIKILNQQAKRASQSLDLPK